MRIHQYLEINDNKKIKCLKCGHVLCDAKENYKDYAPRAEKDPASLPGIRPTMGMHVYYEYYCPNCYTMLDVEVAEKGAPPLWDIQINMENYVEDTTASVSDKS
ncbi:acetone carboxylase gamma subunit [Desulfoscipio gibsoniae]|uniref:Acetone carboxylase gamma subunit n=1 Tax=Desulfoscipio gibsoniae DSM 7213 TaxID=767817 RepID=R4KIZ2_9FIRM|nr:acetone carboxylase gamma subunit [Desulfoscipio gibsoniae]AGL03183.1 Acetone carboxylase gamma subunit [Desulfoscipio gibsoniae DSM 7213]